MEITPILPPDDGPLDFDLLDCVASGPDISVVDDNELHTEPLPVVEILNQSSQVTFFVDCSRPYLILYFKGVERFVSISVLCIDDTKQRKILTMSNKSSFVTVEKVTCKLPLEIESGWQYVCIELDELLANSFGSLYKKCKEVTISGSCRLSKIYFASKRYADCELPNFLRVVQEESA